MSSLEITKTFSTTEDAIGWVKSIQLTPGENFEAAFRVNDCVLAILLERVVPSRDPKKIEMEAILLSSLSFLGEISKDSYLSARVACITGKEETLEKANAIGRSLEGFADTCIIDRAAVSASSRETRSIRIGEVRLFSTLLPIPSIHWKAIKVPSISDFRK